jgi:hypothetical protein
MFLDILPDVDVLFVPSSQIRHAWIARSIAEIELFWQNAKMRVLCVHRTIFSVYVLHTHSLVTCPSAGLQAPWTNEAFRKLASNNEGSR